MGYVFAVAAGLIGGIAALALIERRQYRKHRHARSRAAQTVKEGKGTARKIEFSKLVLSAVLLTYFAGFGLGFWAVLVDLSQLGVFLAYVGTPTATVIGFYSWKAKAENVVKIKRRTRPKQRGCPLT